MAPSVKATTPSAVLAAEARPEKLESCAEVFAGGMYGMLSISLSLCWVRSALHFAAATGNVRIARILCEAGSELDLMDKDGERIQHVHAILVSLLVDRSYHNLPCQRCNPLQPCVSAYEGSKGPPSDAACNTVNSLWWLVLDQGTHG